MALRLPYFSVPVPSYSLRRSRGRNAVAGTATASSRRKISYKSKEGGLILGTPPPIPDKSRYPYEVSALIDKLSSLPPRGSIARCLDSYRGRLSLPDFALVFREFARRGDWQRSLRLFKYMQRQQWCRPDEHILSILISSLALDPVLLPRCLHLFDQDAPLLAIPRTALSYTALINAFARNRDHTTALHLLRRMTDQDRVTPAVPTFNSVLLACSPIAPDSPSFDTLLGLLADMRRYGLRPDLTSYNALLSAAASRSLPDQAESIILSMHDSGVPPDPSSFSYLVESFAKASRLPRVNEILHQLESAGNAPDASCYNVLLDAYARLDDTASTIGVLRQMQAAGCTPNAATYSTLLAVYGRSRRYQDVRELFLEMKVGNTAPDIATYNVLLKVFGEGGYFAEVVTLFRDMVEEGVEPDMETYEGLFFACGMGGMHADTEEMLAYMSRKGLLPSSRAYDGVVEAYGHATLYEEALVTFKRMHEVGSMPTVETYNTLLAMYASGGLFKEAEAILLRMNEDEIHRNQETYNNLVKVYCQSGHFEDALRAFVELQKSGFSPNNEMLESVLELYCAAGLLDESREQFLEIKSLGTQPSVMAYCSLLSLYARSDMWEDAHELLDEMKSSESSNTHQVIGSMIKGEYDDDSNWQMVEYVFDNFKAEGCGFGLQFYNVLLDALWWLGQKARARKVLLEAKSRGLFPELYRQSKLIWSVDVHRMSVGGALIAVLSWLKDMQEKLEKEKDLPQMASIVVVRGSMETSTRTRLFPVAKAVYAFLKEQVSPAFSFPSWNKGRIICQRTPLKRLLTSLPISQDSLAEDNSIYIGDIAFPVPGIKLNTKDSGNGVSSISIDDIDFGLELQMAEGASM